MRDPVEDKVLLDDRQLLTQFVNGIEDSFGAYKLGSSINRTFLNCNFKQKHKTEAENKILEVIEFERQQIEL